MLAFCAFWAMSVPTLLAASMVEAERFHLAFDVFVERRSCSKGLRLLAIVDDLSINMLARAEHREANAADGLLADGVTVARLLAARMNNAFDLTACDILFLLPFFHAYIFVFIAHTLAFIRLRLTQRADFRGHLPHQLLIRAVRWQ